MKRSYFLLSIFGLLLAAPVARAQEQTPVTPSETPGPAPLLPAPLPPPVGRAAPSTEAGTHATGPIRAGLEVFAEYRYRHTDAPVDGSTWFHEFDVPRVHGAIEGEWENAKGRVVLEAVRSAGEGALIGVSGDSFVLRVREAYGRYRFLDSIDVSAGVIPTLTIPDLDGTWMMRAVAPSALESSGLGSAADLGVKVKYDLPQKFGWIALAATNGEGYTSRELNRGKNIEAAFEVHPVPSGPLLPLGVFASYTTGSSGTVSARADRLTTGLVWQGERVRGGLFFTYAWGVAQSGTQRAILGSAFVRVEPVKRVLLGARYDAWARDVGVAPNDEISTAWLTAGYRIADPIEVFLAGSRALATTRADAEVPGSDAWALRVIGRVVF